MLQGIDGLPAGLQPVEGCDPAYAQGVGAVQELMFAWMMASPALPQLSDDESEDE